MTPMPPRFFLRAVLFILMIVPLAVAGAADDAETGIDELMTKYQDLGLFNGAVLVATNGDVVLSKGYGLANMEWAIPNGPDTKFRLGSITKQFTSMIIMQLVEEGKLSLDATVDDLLPYFPSDIGSKITVHHLLTHTSGLPNYTAIPGFFADDSRDPHQVEEFVTSFCSGNLEFEPGSKFRYSNSGYFVLGAIIEVVSGESYEQQLNVRILEKLEMRDTGYDHGSVIMERRAAGYERNGDGYRNAPYLDMSNPFAAGALYSTVEDLLGWDQALYGDALLSEAGKAKMFEPFLDDYAYGWRVTKVPIGADEAERTVVAHGGGINGFNTVIARVIEDRHLVVLLNNTGGTNLRAMQNGIFDLLYGREPSLPKPPVVEALNEALESGGAEAAIARFHELKEHHADEYDFGESQLNNLCYQLMGNGNMDGAIAVCKLNVELFPEAFNPYDSLGEAYMTAGETELAIQNYAKSLELNPENTNAVLQLMRLSGVGE
ncbi:MAG: serine hydrolase [Acidobacteriota bacterium]|nr:serine hydrolase [Acidobacteriota bacterium]